MVEGISHMILCKHKSAKTGEQQNKIIVVTGKYIKQTKLIIG